MTDIEGHCISANQSRTPAQAQIRLYSFPHQRHPIATPIPDNSRIRSKPDFDTRRGDFEQFVRAASRSIATVSLRRGPKPTRLLQQLNQSAAEHSRHGGLPKVCGDLEAGARADIGGYGRARGRKRWPERVGVERERKRFFHAWRAIWRTLWYRRYGRHGRTRSAANLSFVVHHHGGTMGVVHPPSLALPTAQGRAAAAKSVGKDPRPAGKIAQWSWAGTRGGGESASGPEHRYEECKGEGGQGAGEEWVGPEGADML